MLVCGVPGWFFGRRREVWRGTARSGRSGALAHPLSTPRATAQRGCCASSLGVVDAQGAVVAARRVGAPAGPRRWALMSPAVPRDGRTLIELLRWIPTSAQSRIIWR